MHRAGQATLVRSDHAIPFWLVWEHGLFVSTERLAEVGGTMSEPRWGLGHVTLRLKRLLSIADQGICLMRTHPYPLGLTVQSQSCLFATRFRVPPVPLYLFQGAGPIDRDSDWLDISGGNNYYKNTKVVLRVESLGGGAALAEYTFDHFKSLDAATWFSERNPQPATVFSWSTPEYSVDRQQLDDFIQPGAGEGWFVWDFDIVPSELPPSPTDPLPDGHDLTPTLQRLQPRTTRIHTKLLSFVWIRGIRGWRICSLGVDRPKGRGFTGVSPCREPLDPADFGAPTPRPGFACLNSQPLPACPREKIHEVCWSHARLLCCLRCSGEPHSGPAGRRPPGVLQGLHAQVHRR